MIKIENIKKRFGTLQVLKGINLTVNDGEIISIAGPSGAGKTTLLQIIGTLDKPDEGNVCYNGTDVFSLKEKELSQFRNRNIGFIFQFHQLLPEFTALENVCIPAMIAKTDKREYMKRAKELLDFLGLKDRMEHKPSELSRGGQQRVAGQPALSNRPAVILADEPSGSLDTKNKEELHKVFFNLRKETGQTFIIVTHDEQLASTTDRTIHMLDGNITD